MINWRGIRNITIIVILITMLCFLGINGQDVSEQVPEPEEVEPKVKSEPVVLPVTRLTVTIVDGMNDKLVKLENCVVQVLGEMLIVDDVFPYSKTFISGDRYEMTIHIREKK